MTKRERILSVILCFLVMGYLIKDALAGPISTMGLFAEDTAHSSGDIVQALGVVRKDTLASLAGTTGDYTIPMVDATGSLYVTLAGSGAASGLYAEDSAHSSGHTGMAVWAVRNDNPTQLAGTALDYVPISTDSTGLLWVRDTVYVSEDSTANNTHAGYPIFGRRTDAFGSLSSDDGDYSDIQINAKGAVRTSDIPMVPDPSNTIKIELTSSDQSATIVANTWYDLVFDDCEGWFNLDAAATNAKGYLPQDKFYRFNSGSATSLHVLGDSESCGNAHAWPVAE